MSDILRQVDEELRQDRILSLWKNYRFYIIAILIIIIGTIFGYQFNKASNISYNENLLEEYIKITNINNTEQVFEELLQFEKLDHSYFSSFAKLRIANILIKKGDIENSRGKLIEIMNTKGLDPIIADLSLYLYLMSKLAEIEDYEFQSYLTKERIENSHFKYLFKEIIALRKFLSGDEKSSKEDFNALIVDLNSPIEIRNRASKFIDAIK